MELKEMKNKFEKRINIYKKLLESTSDIDKAQLYTAAIYGVIELGVDLGIIGSYEYSNLMHECFRIFIKQVGVITHLQEDTEAKKNSNIPIEDCDKEILGQVIGVVNMDAYNKRHIEEKRLKETAEKKATIEKELEQEINKYKTVTYYEDMAKKYPNNSRLQDLVNKLLELGE